jgi:hypothetical protein
MGRPFPAPARLTNPVETLSVSLEPRKRWMNKAAYYASAAAVSALSLCFGVAGSASQAATKATADGQTQAIVTAATTFLNSLSAGQRVKAQLPFKPEKTATLARFLRSGTSVVPAPPGYVPPKEGAGGPGAGGRGPGGPGGRPGGGPGGPPGGGPPGGPGGAPGQGPPGGFIGERYGEAVWSNYPVSDVLRPGLRLGTLSAAQRQAALHLLQTVLSAKGYQKVLDIMGSDQALTDAGTNFDSGAAVYTICIFGTPSTTAPWMLEFGGHHLGLNVVIAGKQGVMTPTLTGAQPAVYTSNGKTVRVLAGENDKAFALLDALDENQRKQAILNYRVGDLVLGPGHAGETIVPEGLKASAMNERQRARLLDVISEWAGIVNDAYAEPRMAEIKAGLNDTYFAWSGPTTHEPGKNGSSYYRIQGPRLVIEFSPQDTSGDITMHVHTMYRDPTNDYGIKFTNPQ